MTAPFAPHTAAAGPVSAPASAHHRLRHLRDADAQACSLSSGDQRHEQLSSGHCEGTLEDRHAGPVPVVMRGGKPFVSSQFINQVFQSGLDTPFVVERSPNPVNPLTAAEIDATVKVLKIWPRAA